MNMIEQSNNDQFARIVKLVEKPVATSEQVLEMRLNPRAIEKGRSFCRDYLDGHPHCEDFTDEELDLLAAAFITVASSLPITSYDLVRWIYEDNVFDGTAIGEYAAEHLGMKLPEDPAEAAKYRMKEATAELLLALEHVSPGQVVQGLFSSYDWDQLEDIVQLIQDRMTDRAA